MRRSAGVLLLVASVLLAACASTKTAFELYRHPDLGWQVDVPPGGWRPALLGDGGVRLRRADVEGEIAIDLLPNVDVVEAAERLRRGAIEASSEGFAYPEGVQTEVWRFRFPTGTEVVAAFADVKGRGTFVVRRDCGGGGEAALVEAFDLVLRRLRIAPPPEEPGRRR